ncbi:hypothetical protein B0T18DRAFT_12008 [Schizothecium vesticola]|uniref:Uncharacterized protein n=1 Tax=Schizothecium vesticola TaxID=314040 RepID=A0AA40KBP3_9PEZI|nr:hypothetical protein B0T18DRAFT_12008 [Schizothecium vesticola]
MYSCTLGRRESLEQERTLRKRLKAPTVCYISGELPQDSMGVQGRTGGGGCPDVLKKEPSTSMAGVRVLDVRWGRGGAPAGSSPRRTVRIPILPSGFTVHRPDDIIPRYPTQGSSMTGRSAVYMRSTVCTPAAGLTWLASMYLPLAS